VTDYGSQSKLKERH